jgi:hypothetical protein
MMINIILVSFIACHVKLKTNSKKVALGERIKGQRFVFAAYEWSLKRRLNSVNRPITIAVVKNK